MKTIKSNAHNEIIIKNSKFIGLLFKINKIDDINNILCNIKKQYKDYTHCCYAYKIDNVIRYNDDNEPSGTAGMPILNIINKNNLNNVLFIVIRYFGGIKLGAGGLVRAYTKAITECMKKENIIELKKGYKIEISFEYSNLKNIDYLLKNVIIYNKIFDKNIIYTFNISIEDYNNLLLKVNKLAKVEIKENIFI